MSDENNTEPGAVMGMPTAAQDFSGGAPDGDLFGEAPDLGKKKGAGRPKGALNKHTLAFDKLYAQSGFIDPLMMMGDFISRGPLEMCIEITKMITASLKDGEKLSDHAPTVWMILREQHALAKELAPYLHGKKPIEVQITDERLPQLAIILGTDQNTLARELADAGVLSLGAPLDDEEAK